jgi:PrtD family type I secretion system ABC transporter
MTAAMTAPMRNPASVAPELRDATRACRKALLGVAAASGLINLLMLTGPLFMLQVYDRVLPSRSIPTLVGLGMLALVMFALQGLLDTLRGRILVRIGRSLDEGLSPRLFDAAMRSAVQTGVPGHGLQALRDLDSVRSFVSSIGLASFFDLPWTPFYVAICFLFHPWLGSAVLLGACVLCLLALLTEVTTRAPSREAVTLVTARRLLADAACRNAPLLQALGMRQRMAERWSNENAAYLDRQQRMSDIMANLGSLSRTIRLVMQSSILGLGACLVINQEATGGVILAATILSSRALAPVELAIANWRSFLVARQSWGRLSEVLQLVPCEAVRTALPPPRQTVRLAAVSLTPPGSASVVLHDVSFMLAAGRALGVIGPSGSGKSSLARALVGVWKPARGVIRIDGATLDQWPADVLGRSLGYLPQEVELFAGTVAQNISRFATDDDSASVVLAAQTAGVHEIILRLPDGYETQVGEGGVLLSGGQRQRIALARALYGQPFFLVLDEPSSNLDAAGENALTAAIGAIRARGGIVVVIAHRPHALLAVDDVLVLNEGRVQAFGPRAQVLGQMAPPAATGAVPAQPVNLPAKRPATIAASKGRQALETRKTGS